MKTIMIAKGLDLQAESLRGKIDLEENYYNALNEQIEAYYIKHGELPKILRGVVLFDEKDKLEIELIENIKELFKGSVPAETLVRQGVSQAVPEPNASCEKCKHCVVDDEMMENTGFCNKLATASNNYQMWVALDFFCKHFEQK